MVKPSKVPKTLTQFPAAAVAETISKTCATITTSLLVYTVAAVKLHRTPNLRCAFIPEQAPELCVQDSSRAAKQVPLRHHPQQQVKQEQHHIPHHFHGKADDVYVEVNHCLAP
jgi:hypothetical protein